MYLFHLFQMVEPRCDYFHLSPFIIVTPDQNSELVPSYPDRDLRCGLPTSNLYHWWQEPAEAERRICTRAIRELFRGRMDMFGARNLRELVVEKLKLKQADYVRYWRLASGRQSSIRTSNLARTCNSLKMQYSQLESLRVLADRDWPIDLLRPELRMLKSHILNEGTLNNAIVKSVYAPTGRVSFSRRTQAQYYNNDPALHAQIRRLAHVCGSSGCTTTKSRIGYCTVLDATTSRALMRIGVPPGRRSDQRVSLDRRVTTQKHLWRYHFATTLIEEGYCNLRLAPSRRLILEVGYYRGIDVTDVIDRSTVRKLRPGVRTVIGKVPEIVQQIIRDNPPLLMSQEITRLRRLHPQLRGAYDWPDPHPYEVRRCLRGDKVIASWRFVTSRRVLVRILSSYFNVSISSSKRRHMHECYRIYQKYQGRKLSDTQWMDIKKHVTRLW